MLRAYLTDEKRCYLHSHRIVRTSCARCKTAYCDECLTPRTDGAFGRVVARDEKRPAPLFCDRCVEELEALNALEAERKRPLWQRLRPTRAGIGRVAAYLAVIGVIMVPLAFAVRNMAATVLTPEELARIKTGLLGTFQTSEGTNFASQVYGGSYVRASAPAQPGHEPSRLIDTWFAASVPGWRSETATFPQELVFALPWGLKVNKVILRPQPSEPEETWVDRFEVLVSTESATAGFVPVVAGALKDVAAARASADPENPHPLRFEFPETPAKYVMLRVLTNHGSTAYTSLGELEVYWVRK